MTDSILEIHKLTEVYANGVQALQDVTFSVPTGEFHAIIGELGRASRLSCAVSTASLSQRPAPFASTVLMSPRLMMPNCSVRRRIGMVFQHFNLVHRSPVLTNVLAGRLGYINPAWSLFNRFSQKDIAKALAQLERVGLADKAQNRADALSGGQQQRVGIARALMQDPVMILADEPVASLDPVLAHGIMQHLEDQPGRWRHGAL
ncbi:MAG: ATP-binding cassette domain-containing protein [Caldilineaceae bacterium]